MGASILRKKVHGAGFTDVEVTNKAISDLRDEWDLVVTHQDLTPRAAEKTELGRPRVSRQLHGLTQVRRDRRDARSSVPPPKAAAAPPPQRPQVAQQRRGATATAVRTDTEAVLTTDSIVMAGTATDRDGAIVEAGRLLVDAGAVDAAYVDSMLEREQSVSTAMGNGLAIPHGTNEAKGLVQKSAMSVVRFPATASTGPASP